MSRRRTAEILAAIIQAFLEESTWTQAELARRANTSPETVRNTLQDLTTDGWPFERQEERPQVYWSLPRGYLPPGIVLPMDRVALALRLLARLPAEPERDGLLGFLSSASPADQKPSLEAWAQPGLSRSEDRWLSDIEDAIRDRQALTLRYYSVVPGTLESRTISFQRITRDKHVRMCGHCHREHRLKWFRLDGVVEVEGSANESYVATPSAEVDSFFEHSLLGYHCESDATTSVFHVRYPDARWVQRNLPDALSGELTEAGLQVTATDVSLGQVARYVLSLGGAAKPLSDGLRQEVERLARAALSECADPAPSTEQMTSHDK